MFKNEQTVCNSENGRLHAYGEAYEQCGWSPQKGYQKMRKWCNGGNQQKKITIINAKVHKGSLRGCINQRDKWRGAYLKYFLSPTSTIIYNK